MQPRRKRSKLTEDTFAPVQSIEVQTNGEHSMNGHADKHGRKSSMSVETTLDIPLRGKKAAPKRAVKADGSIIMV